MFTIEMPVTLVAVVVLLTALGAATLTHLTIDYWKRQIRGEYRCPTCGHVASVKRNRKFR